MHSARPTKAGFLFAVKLRSAPLPSPVICVSARSERNAAASSETSEKRSAPHKKSTLRRNNERASSGCHFTIFFN
jgi:hypothetical protein